MMPRPRSTRRSNPHYLRRLGDELPRVGFQAFFFSRGTPVSSGRASVSALQRLPFWFHDNQEAGTGNQFPVPDFSSIHMLSVIQGLVLGVSQQGTE